MHQYRIVHRDLKSQNVLFDASGVAKLCDFGLSVSISTSKSMMTADSQGGTPAYMAPEIITHNHVSSASDVYAFGVILYELTSGRLPWAGMQPFQIMDTVRQGTAQLSLPDNADTTLATVARACLQRDPKSRPPFPRICEMLGSVPEPEEQPDSQILQRLDELSGQLAELNRKQDDHIMMGQ